MHRHIYISLAVILMATSAPFAVADTYVPVSFQKVHNVESDFTRYAQKKISPSDAKSIARRKVSNADVIDISLDGNTYKVRMQKKNGHVVDVYVDATTGRVE